MSGVPHACAHPGAGFEPGVVILDVHAVESCFAIGFGVDGFDLSDAAPRIAAVEALDFRFLDIARIRPHIGQQIARALRGVDFAGEALVDQFRHQTRVVHMGVGQQYEIDGLGVEGERFQVQVTHAFDALEQPAIDQELALGMADQVTRPGHRTRGAQEFDFDVFGELLVHDGLPLWVWPIRRSGLIGWPAPLFL